MARCRPNSNPSQTLTLTLTPTPTPTLTLTLPLTVQDLGVPISSASLCREGLVLHLQARMGIGSKLRLLTCSLTH